MERVKKSKQKMTLDTLLFVSPEQKLMRFLLSNPTTTFTPRVLLSKLKGVRGLGGIEGINRILKQLEELGLVQFYNNNRSVGINNENSTVILLKRFVTVCDLDGLREVVEPISDRCVLFGSRASGTSRSDSDYDLFVVSDSPGQIEKIVTRHPLGRRIELVCWTPDDFLNIENKDPSLAQKLDEGIVMWGTSW